MIDDDHDVRVALEDALAFAGYEVDLAASADEGLRLIARDERPSLILLDLVMPEADGWTFSSELQTEEGRRPIPVIVMTAHGEPLLRTAPVSAGYMLKPLDLDVLLATVRRCIEASESAATDPRRCRLASRGAAEGSSTPTVIGARATPREGSGRAGS